jgi:hypothetical protein
MRRVPLAFGACAAAGDVDLERGVVEGRAEGVDNLART